MPIRKLYTGVQCNTIHYSQKLEKNYPLVNKNESLLIHCMILFGWNPGEANLL